MRHPGPGESRTTYESARVRATNSRCPLDGLELIGCGPGGIVNRHDRRELELLGRHAAQPLARPQPRCIIGEIPF